MKPYAVIFSNPDGGEPSLVNIQNLSPMLAADLLAGLADAGHIPAMAVAVDRAQHDGKSAEGYRDAEDVEAIEEAFLILCDANNYDFPTLGSLLDSSMSEVPALLATRISESRRMELFNRLLRRNNDD